MVKQMLLMYGATSLALGLVVVFESNRSKIKLMESAKIGMPGTVAGNDDKWRTRKISADTSEITYNLGAVLVLLGIVLNFFAA